MEPSSSSIDRGLGLFEYVAGDGSHELRSIEESLLLLRSQTVLDVAVLEDLFERAPAIVLANDVPRNVLLRGVALEEK